MDQKNECGESEFINEEEEKENLSDEIVMEEKKK